LSLSGLGVLLRNTPSFQGLANRLRRGERFLSVQAPEEAWAYCLSAFEQELGRPLLIVTPKPEDATRLYDQIQFYFGDHLPIYHLAEREVLPYERILTDATSGHERLSLLNSLLWNDGKPLQSVVVSSSIALIQKTIPRDLFKAACHTIRNGQRIEVEGLIKYWTALGYKMEADVQVPGGMSRRGGILDIYPPNLPMPARLELWGDYVDSIRLFDPGNQRTVKLVESLSVIPAQEILIPDDKKSIASLLAMLDFSSCTITVRERIQEELSALMEGSQVDELGFLAGFFNTGSLLDYLPDQSIVVMCGPSQIDAVGHEMDERLIQLRNSKVSRGEIPGNFPWPHYRWDEIRATIDRLQSIHLERWEERLGNANLEIAQAPSFWGNMKSFVSGLEGMVRDKARVIVVSHHCERLAKILSEAGIGVSITDRLDQKSPLPAVTLLPGVLNGGWSLQLRGEMLTLLTDYEIFGASKRRRQLRKRPTRRGAFFADIESGGYVVHLDHGIARFSGTIRLGLHNEQRDYLILEYAAGDRIYVPIDQMDRITVYVGSGDRIPALSRLGTQEWDRAKSRVKDSARVLALELLDLYAAREVAEGIAFSVDSPWQQEMEESFPYEETPDQMATILEVKHDMERARPMDRLVCGDVGYGKTEIALRAAFKAIMDNAQVAVLVPTTVLAQQHFVTFSDRLKLFPAKIEVLSRFRTDKDQRDVVERLAQGNVDVCIGTHRLLQKDVRFKNLGLIIIDEEQRFGVAHKERLKRMRKEVDVLSLSATPIPRTLHMALAGIRDMSTMETPPEERLPIKTFVSEYSDDLVREALLRELDRGGQAFFLHNRVNNIAWVANRLNKLVPEANIVVAHGQMHENQLEEVMSEFANGLADVLVCTTIIEAGLDIPNVNTLLVDRADTFGLAQLYQLRGRIGRGSNRAYAYFLVPKGKVLSESAQKRLSTIVAATELGSGFHIAMRDLEIRGAGNILGSEQSGQIHSVGFDLYTSLMSEAIEELKENSSNNASGAGLTAVAKESKVDLKLNSYLPDDYVGDISSRLLLYRRLGEIIDLQGIEALEAELRDRFGPLPDPAKNLLYAVSVKLLAQFAGVSAVIAKKGEIALRLWKDVGGAQVALTKALGQTVRVGHQQILIPVGPSREAWRNELVGCLERLTRFTASIVQSTLISE